MLSIQMKVDTFFWDHKDAKKVKALYEDMYGETIKLMTVKRYRRMWMHRVCTSTPEQYSFYQIEREGVNFNHGNDNVYTLDGYSLYMGYPIMKDLDGNTYYVTSYDTMFRPVDGPGVIQFLSRRFIGMVKRFIS